MNSSRLIPITILFLMGFGCSIIAPKNSREEGIRSGRSIQLDGFLIDWPEKMRRQWTGSTIWFWDAAATPEGVAGYCTSKSAPCSSWTIDVAAWELSRSPWEMKNLNGGDAHSDRYRARHESHNGVNTITIEWLIPWDSIAVNSGGAYAIHVAGRSVCGDNLAPFFLNGNIHDMNERIPLPRMFTARLIIIAIMLGLFIGLQVVVRKKSRRRESLRRST